MFEKDSSNMIYAYIGRWCQISKSFFSEVEVIEKATANIFEMEESNLARD